MMAVIRRLNYQHLLYFWSVVRTGSLTRACEELALSAPTISAQLRTLEARLGEKLLEKSGRTLVPTEVGRLVYSYADRDLRPGTQVLWKRSNTGPRAVRCAWSSESMMWCRKRSRIASWSRRSALKQPVRLICREGTLERLVADLAVHDIDLVLSDAPVTPSLSVRAYSHHLGTSEDGGWRRRRWPRPCGEDFPNRSMVFRFCFPPMTRPSDARSISGSIRHDVQPVIIGEFEDYAMLREFARAGHGFTSVPSVLAEQFRRQYGFARSGPATGSKPSSMRSRSSARSSIPRSR